MKTLHAIPLLLSTLLLSAPDFSYAQNAPVNAPATREQVKMDREAFLAMFEWHDQTSQWVLKSGMTAPQGVTPRADVKAEREKFLSMNRWNENTTTWVPVKGEPRDMSKLSRAQVKKESAMFAQTHRYDEPNSKWVLKNAPTK